ncbi:MAG TPA: EAL domain-containing protein, partial [Acidobacteriota bacterium]
LKFFSIHRLPGDNFLVVLYSGDPEKTLAETHLAQVSALLEERLNEYLMSRLAPEISPFARIFNGYSLLEYNSNVRFERSIARAINKAYQSAVGQQERMQQTHIQQLEEIVRNNQIRILFQPILALRDLSEVIGHEALSRGPEGSLFEAAEFMFSLAGHCGMLQTLENLCQTRLISTIEEQGISQLIFVNLEPSFLEAEEFTKLALFSSDRVRPENVVLEITERVAIRDYELVSRALETIRKRGFRIAVDDVGSGYASLQSIAYLKPDFIKISEKMVQGISSDFIKQEIVKTLRDLASRFSASLIAEGIEQEQELKTLRELQVPYGQGFLFHRPADRLLP